MPASRVTSGGDSQCLPALRPATLLTRQVGCPRSLPRLPAGAKALTKSSANSRLRPASTSRGILTDGEETRLMFADANYLSTDFDLAFYQLSSSPVRGLKGLYH